MADKFYVPSDYGFIDCDKVKVTGYDFPDVVFGNEWHGWITFEEDEDEATYVDVDACPAWISYDLSAGRVDFTGVPDKKEYIGDVVLNISLSNCMENDPSGEGHDSLVGQFEVLCVPAAVTGSSFPTATWMVAWSGWVTFEGTDPLNLAVTSCPSWASYTIGEDRIDFSGTPDTPGTATFTYTYQNCGYDTETATNSITVECTNVAVASSSFPDVEFGKAWTGYVTFSGTTPYTLAVTSCPSWVSYTIGTARIDFSGTPSSNSVIGTNTIRYTYANCAAAAVTGTATFEVTCVQATVTSAVNMGSEDESYYVDYGAEWTGTVTWDPGSGDVSVEVYLGTNLRGWVTYSQSGNMLTFTGTPDDGSYANKGGSIIVYLTSCGVRQSYYYDVRVNPTYYMQTYTSSGTFTVPAGIHWLRACLMSGPNGGMALRYDGSSSNFLGVSTDAPSTVPAASGGTTSFGGVSSPKITMGYYAPGGYIEEYTDRCDCTYYEPGLYYSEAFGYTSNFYSVTASYDMNYWIHSQDGDNWHTRDGVFGPCYFSVYKGVSLECSRSIGANDELERTTSDTTGAVSGFADYYGDYHYPSQRGGTIQMTTTCPEITVTNDCDVDYRAFEYGHTHAAPYRVVYLSVTPGATYSYTMGSAGSACYWADGSVVSTGSTVTDGTGTGTIKAGTGTGAIMLEWGSVIENAYHNYTATPTAAYSVPVSAASVPDVVNMYSASRAPAEDSGPMEGPDICPIPGCSTRLPDDENTES